MKYLLALASFLLTALGIFLTIRLSSGQVPAEVLITLNSKSFVLTVLVLAFIASAFSTFVFIYEYRATRPRIKRKGI